MWFTISGYAVIKKWLSYREKNFTPDLTVDEAVTSPKRRAASRPDVDGPQLDDNYRTVVRGPQVLVLSVHRIPSRRFPTKGPVFAFCSHLRYNAP